METVTVATRVTPIDAARIRLLAAMRNVKQAELLQAGIQHELANAPELPEIERLIASGYGQDDAQ